MGKKIFIGTDSGATTTKFSGVWENGETISTKLMQLPTGSEKGRGRGHQRLGCRHRRIPRAEQTRLAAGSGRRPGDSGQYERYGVFGRTPNLPASFSGWDVYADYSAALAKQAGRAIPLVVGNDGNYGGVAEAQIARGQTKASVMMLMPGSGLGAAFSSRTGWRSKATPLPGWKPATCPHPCICSVSKAASHFRAAAVATGAVSRLTRPSPACRCCWRKNWQNIPVTNSPSPPRR